ncbi:MAG TPA: N-6 DNA methylase [Thermoanaerobaculia bacterium]
MPVLPDTLPASDGRLFLDRLRAFGCTDVVDLSKGAAAPAQLEYLDLLPKRGQPNPLPAPVAAVAEHQGAALLYLVDGYRMEPGARERIIHELQHQLANRSDPAYLGIVTGGTLDIYPIEFHRQDRRPPRPRALHTIEQTDRSAPLFFQSLVHGKFGELHKKPHGSDHVYKVIMDLLDGTTAQFGADPKQQVPSKLPPLEVLSLAGRALFFRFLVDRGVVLPSETPVICPSAQELRLAFATAASAAEASAWLDKTFNGDFLPLIDDEEIPSNDREARQAAYLAYYQKIHSHTDGSIFIHLDAILRGWSSVDGRHIQPTLDFGLDWSDLNFAHIPVGVLSQVYENFSHRADRQFAKSTSVHYTPRTIARFLVDEAFDSLADPAHARVLDPACGAGIFLVLTLRRLVKERWQCDGHPPNAETIRQILYKQICGFDISEPALRLAALGLYITAIEINQSPRPPKSLKFPRNLRDTVLFNFNEFRGQPDKQGSIPLGSLGNDVPREKFDKQFHLVLGNPPWTALRAPTPVRTAEKAAQRRNLRSEGKVIEKEETTKLNECFTGIARRVLKEKACIAKQANLEELATELERLANIYENPRKNPDLPFLWRATEWATEGGTLALVLPARLYLLGPKTGTPSGHEDEENEEAPQVDGTDHMAWRAVMQSMAITGIINGSDLRKTGVWRGVDVPFSIFFARNELPTPRHAFRFASPCYELRQHERGHFRIDYQNDVLVTYREVLEKPWLLKALVLGNSLDVNLIERLQAAFKASLGGFWFKWDPQFRHTGEGYNVSPGLTQKLTDFLHLLPDFREPDGWRIELPLPTFEETHGRKTAHMPRRKELFAAKLVIVPKSPGQERHRPHAWISYQDMAFSKTWYGYSCAGHPESDVLSSLIYLLPHSQIFLYYILLTSPCFGADRQTFNKGDLDSMPFPDPADLCHNDKVFIKKLAHLLEEGSEKPWKEIDALFARLYGLNEADCELMEDTLFSTAFYRTKGAAAFHPPMPGDVKIFTDCLQETLQPFLAITGRTVRVRPADFPQDVYRDSWYFVEATASGQCVSVTPGLLEQAIAIANDLGASRVVVRAQDSQAGLLLGQIAQRRWWTKTRARLCATHIIHNHLDALRPYR